MGNQGRAGPIFKGGPNQKFDDKIWEFADKNGSLPTNNGNIPTNLAFQWPGLPKKASVA